MALDIYTITELQLLEESLKQREAELLLETSKLREQLKKINNILNIYKDISPFEDNKILLPKDFLTPKSYKLNTHLKKLNWKDIAMDIIKDHNGLMTTVMIYEKAKDLYPLQLINRKLGIAGFSAALHYLCKDIKLFCFKDDVYTKRENVFGLPSFFNKFSSIPTQQYIEKYLRDRGGGEKTDIK